MWFVKKTASGLYKTANTSLTKLKENMPDLQQISSNLPNIKMPTKSAEASSQVEKAMTSVLKNKKQIMPTSKMGIIAEMSYQIQKFQEILEIILKKLQTFQFEPKRAKQILNTMVLVCYLIKHGASGLVDELRHEIQKFRSLSELSLQNAYLVSEKSLAKLKILLPEIRDRGQHIVFLLTDKKRFLKEKQIAMKIKENIILRETGSFENSDEERNLNADSLGANSNKSEKVDSFLEHYVWKYWNKFDDKMQAITEKIIEKIDQYVEFDAPESFEIDQIESSDEKSQETDTNMESPEKLVKERIFIAKKDNLDIDIQEDQPKGPVLNVELI